MAIGSSINSSVLKEKEHPPVVNISVLIKNLFKEKTNEKINCHYFILIANLFHVLIKKMKYLNEKRTFLNVCLCPLKFLKKKKHLLKCYFSSRKSIW